MKQGVAFLIYSRENCKTASWKNEKTTVASSVAAGEAVKEALWLKSLTKTVNINLEKSTEPPSFPLTKCDFNFWYYYEYVCCRFFTWDIILTGGKKCSKKCENMILTAAKSLKFCFELIDFTILQVYKSKNVSKSESIKFCIFSPREFWALRRADLGDLEACTWEFYIAHRNTVKVIKSRHDSERDSYMPILSHMCIGAGIMIKEGKKIKHLVDRVIHILRQN